MNKQEFMTLLQTDRLYGTNERMTKMGFKILCDSHPGLEAALDSGDVVQNGNDVWMGKELIVEIKTEHLSGFSK